MWLVVVVGHCVVGCEHCSHPTTQRPTTATNHIQQNQRSTPYEVTHGLCSPEDRHNDARNMLKPKLIINIWLLQLVGFILSLRTLLTMHGHRNLKIAKTIIILPPVRQNYITSLYVWYSLIHWIFNNFGGINCKMWSSDSIKNYVQIWGNFTFRLTFKLHLSFSILWPVNPSALDYFFRNLNFLQQLNYTWSVMQLWHTHTHTLKSIDDR